MSNKKDNNVNIKLNQKVLLDSDVNLIIKSSKAIRYLRNNDINSINELLNSGKRMVLNLPGLSEKSSSDVINTIHSLGLYFIDEQQYKKRIINDLLDIEITYFNFSARAYHALRRAGIETVRDLLFHRKKDLQELNCIGNTTLNEIVDKVHKAGLLFPEEDSNFFEGVDAKTEIQKLTRYKDLIAEREKLNKKIAMIDDQVYAMEHIFDKKEKQNVK